MITAAPETVALAWTEVITMVVIVGTIITVITMVVTAGITMKRSAVLSLLTLCVWLLFWVP